MKIASTITLLLGGGEFHVALVSCYENAAFHLMRALCLRLWDGAGENDQSEPVKANELSPEDSEVLIQGSDTDFLIKLLFISIGGANLQPVGCQLHCFQTAPVVC